MSLNFLVATSVLSLGCVTPEDVPVQITEDIMQISPTIVPFSCKSKHGAHRNVVQCGLRNYSADEVQAGGRASGRC